MSDNNNVIETIETKNEDNNDIDVSDYGFIISRHVTCSKTNRYWNNAVISIRTLYPLRKIVIIDDNSNQSFVNAFFNYKNVIIINSEYEKRGELLPYYYFYKYKFFKNAVIIHDSVFIRKRIAFEKIIGKPVIPLWHFDADREHMNERRFLVKKLKNNAEISKMVSATSSFLAHKKWVGCFGVQSFINLIFLEHIENKYNLFNLLYSVKCRLDRCALERIFGVIFCIECPNVYSNKSILGNIHKYSKWGYTFDEFVRDRTKKQIFHPVVKVWTGR